MIKKLITVLLALFAAAAFAAVDVNKATQADLEAVKGIGPSISGKILDERKKGSFKDWQDLVDRVKGVGEGNAAKFSTEGLTVNGAAFSGAPAKAAAPAAKKEDQPMAAKPAVAASTAAPAVQADAKPAVMSADDKKAAAVKEKADKKAAKAAAADQAKQAKADKTAAKVAAKEGKAAAATPVAASASAAAKK